MKPYTNELHNITNPHAFLISKTEDGKITLQYKHWASDKMERWKPNSIDNPDDPDRRIILLKVRWLALLRVLVSHSDVYKSFHLTLPGDSRS